MSWAVSGMRWVLSLARRIIESQTKAVTGIWLAATGTPKEPALPLCYATRKLSHPAGHPSSNPPGVVLVPLAP